MNTRKRAIILPINRLYSLRSALSTEINPNPFMHTGNHFLGRILFFILMICLNTSVTRAQFRKYSNEFLNIGAGARALAMGGAQIASVNDATAGYWNPSGLARVNARPTFSLMHAEYFAGIGKYDFVSFATPLGNGENHKRTIGFSLIRFAVDDIPNTLFLVEPDGTINYNNIRSFSSADYAFLLSYAQKLIDEEDRFLSIGFNAKVIHRSVGSFAKAWGFGLDGGVMYQTANLKAAVMAKDITTTFNAWMFNFTDEEKEILYLTKNDIPVKSVEMTAPRLVVGLSYTGAITEKLSLSGEMNAELTFDGKRNVLLRSNVLNADPRVGMELGYRDLLFGRLGIYNFQQAIKDGDPANAKVWIYQPGLGVGFKFKNLVIDYAFTNLANQSNPLYTHIFSLRMDLTNPPKKNK